MATINSTIEDHEALDETLNTVTIEGVTFYQIDYDQDNYDETDSIDPDVAERRKECGWWGYHSKNSPDRLPSRDLKAVLDDKAKILENDPNLDSTGVYIYINRRNDKKYIGKAAKQSLLQRQQQHLRSATHSKGQVGKFDRTLSKQLEADGWDFIAIPFSDPEKIDEVERNLVLLYKTYQDKCGYNTQIPGGR